MDSWSDSQLLDKILDVLEEERNDLPESVEEKLDEIHEERRKEEGDYESLKRKVILVITKTFSKEAIKEIFDVFVG